MEMGYGKNAIFDQIVSEIKRDVGPISRYLGNDTRLGHGTVVRQQELVFDLSHVVVTVVVEGVQLVGNWNERESGVKGENGRRGSQEGACPLQNFLWTPTEMRGYNNECCVVTDMARSYRRKRSLIKRQASAKVSTV